MPLWQQERRFEVTSTRYILRVGREQEYRVVYITVLEYEYISSPRVPRNHQSIFSMNPTHPNSWKHLQQAVDDEIKSLKESFRAGIQALKSRRNTHSPVSSLPPEVFATIFSYVCLPGIRSLGGKPHKSHLARLRISHVCHQWREMAINQPLLWGHIDFNTLTSAGTTEILVRAKLAPLYLEARVHWDYAKVCIFQKELQSLVPRICHLNITADFDTLQSTLKRLVSPAPNLEYLSVFPSTRFVDAILIPHNLFDGCTPRLSYLELRNCDISWKSPLFKGLKYLKIIRLSTSPELTVWLDALCEMPQLKALTLQSASPTASFPFDVERTLTLSSLTLLDISGSEGDCALALAHLDLPALTCLRLTVFVDLSNYSSDVQDLLPYVMRHAHGPQDAHPLQSVLISNFDREYYHYLRIAAWTVPDIDTEVHDPPALLGATFPPRITLSFESGGQSRSFNGAHRQILDFVMVALPLNGIVMFAAQDLHITSDLVRDLKRSSSGFATRRSGPCSSACEWRLL